ncbi:MAG: hypothetical protein ABI577_09550 [bacterium]
MTRGGRKANLPENGATSPSGGAHPGKVVFEDEVEGTSRTTPASELPRTIAWAEDEDGKWVAVTRIVSTGTDGRREITKFAADGRFLETTVQSAPPPQRRPAPPRREDDLPQMERPK